MSKYFIATTPSRVTASLYKTVTDWLTAKDYVDDAFIELVCEGAYPQIVELYRELSK